jgi:hypothetical protein
VKGARDKAVEPRGNAWETNEKRVIIPGVEIVPALGYARVLLF